MGWLYMQSLDGHSGPRQYLDAQFTCQRGDVTMKVLRSALVRMRTYYAALEYACLSTGEHSVVGVIFSFATIREIEKVTSSATKIWKNQWGHASPNAPSRSSIF